MSQHELLDQSILPKANGLKKVFCEKKRGGRHNELFTHGKTFYRIK